MKKIRAVIIGCGGRSRAHINAYQFIPGAEVVACCDLSEERRERLAAEYKISKYARALETIKNEQPDLVHLVTPPGVRVELMTLVSTMGVPMCTVEKPVALGVQDWQALNQLAAETKTKFAVCHQFRWQPHLVKCQQAVKEGQIGQVKFLDISAGMNIANQGTHILNYGRSLAGDPKVTLAAGNAFGWDEADLSHPAPKATTASLVFDNGLRAAWTTGPISPTVGDPTTTWQHVRTAAYGDQGRVNYEEFGAWEIVTPTGRQEGNYGGMETWSQNNLQAQVGFHQSVIAWGKGGKEAPGTSLEASLHEWKVVLAVYTSAIEGEPVEIESFNPAADLMERLTARLKIQLPDKKANG